MNKEIDIQKSIGLTQSTPTAQTLTYIENKYPVMMSGTTSTCYRNPYVQIGCASYSGNLSQIQGFQNMIMGQCAVIGNISGINKVAIGSHNL